ncbi:MAG: hypothetical protein JRG88_12590 [Deltaproteobacteria bacterium]|nr:hypothetical protein [Deltaproteobacteria bacterium]
MPSMEFTTFHTLEKLLDAADKAAASCDTISLDIFDTVLIRRIHNPDMIKPAVARFIARLAVLYGKKGWSWEKVQALRDEKEAAQRAETAKKFVDHEARYPDFMTAVLNEVFHDQMTPAVLEKVTGYELALESAMIVPRAGFADWIRTLFKMGKNVFLISDIYLPSTHLKRLIQNVGLIDAITEVISSADSFLAKASGEAFPMIQKRYALDVHRWMHIGDNPISDGLRPVQFGIKAFVLNDKREKRRKTVARMYTVFSNQSLFWKGRALHQLMLPLEAENSPRDPLYVDGYTFLAPLVGVFIQSILERARRGDIGRIYFLSREGWTFKKFWEKAVPFLAPEGGGPDVRYLYVSRLALAGPSCAVQGIPQTKADIAFQPPGNRDMRDFCRVFGLDMDPLMPLMRRYGLSPEDALSPLHQGWSQNNRFKFVYLVEDRDFQEEVRRQTRPAHQALMRYLEMEGFFEHRDVILVDVGWTGTIQRFLFDAIRHRSDKPRLHGYLFAAGRGIPYPSTDENHITGVLYDKDRFDFAASTILNVRDFFEEAFRAPHPGLKGYRVTETGQVLEFRNENDGAERAETAQNAHYHPLQQGILDGAPRFAAAAAVTGFCAEEIKPWIRYLLVSRIAFPKTREIQRIRHKHHLDDFYGKHPVPKRFLKQQKRLWDESLASLRFNPWIRLKYYLFKERIR